MSGTVVHRTRRSRRTDGVPDPTLGVVQEHKVTVRFCAGYECRAAVTTHRVRQNIHGYREYCSLFCYSRWPPEMRTVIARYPVYDQSPNGLECLIFDLIKDRGVQGAAEELGISRSTVSYWKKKLATFRHFAGQDRNAILMLLAAVAETAGISTAAELVAIAPETLEKAFEGQQPVTQAA